MRKEESERKEQKSDTADRSGVRAQQEKSEGVSETCVHLSIDTLSPSLSPFSSDLIG